MSKFQNNDWYTTPLTLNVMHTVAERLELNIGDDAVADELYWVCCSLEDWPEGEGFGSSDSYGFVREAERVFHIPAAA